MIVIKPKYKTKILLQEMCNTENIRNKTLNIKQKTLLLKGFIS